MRTCGNPRSSPEFPVDDPSGLRDPSNGPVTGVSLCTPLDFPTTRNILTYLDYVKVVFIGCGTLSIEQSDFRQHPGSGAHGQDVFRSGGLLFEKFKEWWLGESWIRASAYHTKFDITEVKTIMRKSVPPGTRIISYCSPLIASSYVVSAKNRGPVEGPTGSLV